MRMAHTVFVAAMLAIAATASADGPGAYRPVERPAFPTPELGAIDAYNHGYGEIRRADALLEDETMQEQVEAAYESALKEFDRAVKLDPSMHEAYTYIGYANRQLRRYDAALTAYKQALRINPDYPPAIEYQGEAFVHMGRIDDAKFNYLRLYAVSPPLAAKLLASMQQWTDANSSSAELREWISERTALAAKAGNGRAGSSW